MEKLRQIQTELNVPKNLFNKFGNYNYRSAEGIIKAVKPYLQKFKCTLKLNDEIIQVGDRYYVKATATIIDDETKETETASANAREPQDKKGMDDSQLTGSTSSYARKYALNGLFLLDDNKDPDSIEKEDDDTAKKKPNYKRIKIYEIINGTPIKASEIDGFIEKMFNKKMDPNDLDDEQFKAFCDVLYRKIDKLMDEVK